MWRRISRVILAVTLAVTTFGADALFSQGRQAPRHRRTVMLDGREVVEGEVIVRYRARTGVIERERAEFQIESDTSETVGRRGSRRVRSRRMTTRQMLAALRDNPDVEFAEPNFIIRASAIPNDPSMGSLWGLRNTGQVVAGRAGVPGADIGAVQAWDRTTGSRANVIAILDTGVDISHPDLAANLFSAPRQFSVTIGSTTVTCPAGSRGFNALNSSCVPADDAGHGTHVAGIIGAVGNNNVGVTGVNWTASLMAIKVLGADGTGTTTDAINGIDFAIKAKAALGADANIRVLNASWGGTFSQALEDEIAAASNADMLLVAAAGSTTSNNDTTPRYPASSMHSNVLSVAAVDNTGALASFSNYGATSVDLAAPGASILSTRPNDTYGSLSGSSMAAPHVAGAAALVLSVCPSNTATLKATLLAGVDPEVSLSDKTVSGGRLNVGGALQECLGDPPALTIGDVSVSEGNSGTSTATFTVTLAPVNPSQTVTVNYATADGTATSGSDYLAVSGTLTFPASTATRTFTVTINGDTTSESNETFVVNLSGATNAAIADAQATGTITNDDVAEPSITAASTTVSPGGVITFTVANGPGNGWDWVALHRTTDPDSTFVDWVYLSGTRTQPAPGQTSATIQLTAPATPGTYHARLFANNTYTKLATSNVVTTPTFSISDVTVAEGQSGTSVASFTVTLAPATSAATVAYATANGSASSGTDYTAASGTLSFAAGVATQTISVTIAGDSVAEPTETFVVNLSNATNAAISDAQGVGTITNDDVAAPSVTAASTSANPGGVITFTIANGPGNGWDWVALHRTTDPDGTFVDWVYLGGTRTQPSPGLTDATIQLTAPATPGTYHARLFANNTYTKLATSNVVTVASPSVTPASATVSPGGVISVTVANGPGNGWDWVALHSTTAPDGTFVDWMYMSGTRTQPSPGLTNATIQLTAPATPGTYNVRLFANNTYTKLATSITITVQ